MSMMHVVPSLTSGRARGWCEKVQIKCGRSTLAENIVANSAGLDDAQGARLIGICIPLNPDEGRVKALCFRLGFQMQALRFPRETGERATETGQGREAFYVR